MRPPSLSAMSSGMMRVLLLASLLSPTLADQAPPELKIEELNQVTCTRPSRDGDTISVHYRGTLQSDGTEFDASYNRGQPFKFQLGAHRVIKGWEQGLQNMCIGGKRKLIIPPNLAYGFTPVGPIPGGSTLIFDTELMGIDGVEAEPQTTAVSSSIASSTMVSSSATEQMFTILTVPSTPTPTAVVPDGASDKVEEQKGSEAGPTQQQSDDDNGECRLLGPFALIVQAALGALALLSLVFKRWRETPRRPVKIWFFDASKQVVGSVLLHLANLFMSMLSSGDLEAAQRKVQAASTTKLQDNDGNMPNPCSFYLLNLAIDTTIGIPILVIFLRILHILFKRTPLARPVESIKSGNYGQPPRWTWWMKQCLIYFLGLFGMKFCVFLIFKFCPWLAWVGDWALKWTEGNEALQIAFVMFLFPVLMNAIQYYIIDSFIKDKDAQESPDRGLFERVPSNDDDDDDDDESESRAVDGARRNRSATQMSDESESSAEERQGLVISQESKIPTEIRSKRSKESLAATERTMVPGSATSGSVTPVSTPVYSLPKKDLDSDDDIPPPPPPK